MKNPFNINNKRVVTESKKNLFSFLDDALDNMNEEYSITLDVSNFSKLNAENTQAILSFFGDAAIDKFHKEGVLQTDAATIIAIMKKCFAKSGTPAIPDDPNAPSADDKTALAPSAGGNNGIAPAGDENKK